MIKTTLAVVLACGVAAGVAQAQQIDVTLTGTLRHIEGVDFEGFNGASLQMTASFDGGSLYEDGFGLPKTIATASNLFIGGSELGFNENVAFYPTFAGTFSDPAGLQLTFNGPGGSLMEFIGNMFPGPGAAGAAIGGPVSLEHFIGAVYEGTGGAPAVVDVAGGTFTLDNPVFTVVPAPAGAALLGIGGLLAARRRR